MRFYVIEFCAQSATDKTLADGWRASATWGWYGSKEAAEAAGVAYARQVYTRRAGYARHRAKATSVPDADLKQKVSKLS